MTPLTYREWLEQVAARDDEDGRFAAALLKRLERNAAPLLRERP